jgi:hypothetical protein
MFTTFHLGPQNPLPYSNPLTAFIESIALPYATCQKQAPKPIGTF